MLYQTFGGICAKKISMIAATTLLFVACDNSSSDPSSSQQEGSSQNTVLDALPFDTTGIKSQTISFLRPEEVFNAYGLRQHKEKQGEFWENYITLKFYSKDYTHIDNNGIITMEPSRKAYEQPSVLVVRDDSLMLGPATYCRQIHSWGACDSIAFYSGKITIGNKDFYYNESEKQLIQLNDSSITFWYADGRLYVPFAETDKDSPSETASWAKELFENETCKAWGYKNDSSKTSAENCNARAERYNESFDCRRRNMGAPKGARVSLCRPKSKKSPNVWCILDEDKPQK